MRTPSTRMRTLGVAAVVVLLLASSGCLSGPLGAGTSHGTTTTTVAETTSPDGPTGTTTSPDGTTPPTSSTDEDPGDSNDVDVAYATPGSGPNLAADLPEATACEGVWVSYWGTGDVDRTWRTDDLHVGWTVPANQSMLFVAFENDTVVGADHVQYDGAVTADGATVPVDDTTDDGRYVVVAFADVNENGEYDAGTDRPCEDDSDDADAGAIVMTEWLWVDWDPEA